MSFAFCLLAPSAFAQSISPSCFPARPIPIDHWRGEYFNNPDVNGAPVMVRDDTQPGGPSLDFDWKLDSPDKECGVGVDNFSARWTRTVAFAGGAYRFTVTSDDGVRLLIDGRLQLDQWNDHPLTTHTVDVPLTAGNHKLELQYYERWGSAAVRLRWEQHPCIATVAPDHWRGEYFNNDALAGTPVVVRDDGDGTIFFDWRFDNPNAVCGVSSNQFSVRWGRRIAFGDGLYRFDVSVGGGARVFVDGQLRFDEWRSPATFSKAFELQLSGGNHQIVFEYRKAAARAGAALRWRPIPCVETVPGNHWRGEYFNSDNLSGNPVMVRDDGDAFRGVDFNWGDASPSSACAVRPDNFSVRWTGEQIFRAGVYRFTVAAAGGIRFYVDGQLRVDKWDEHVVKQTVDVALTVGGHRFVLEYAKLTSKAAVKLTWQSPPCVAPVPAERWRGEYFANPDLAGRPLVVRDEGDGRLDFDWGLDKPHPDCLALTDNFSARWTRTASFAAGTYRFNATADDGVRLFVDGQKVIDEWREHSAERFSADVELTEGAHRIVLEYYERWGSASVRLTWMVAPCTAIVPAERWRGEYFNNLDFSGKPALIRDDGNARLDFDWGVKGPDGSCGVNADNFSARWTRAVSFAEGIYRFTVTADDGVRVFLDGQLKLDHWRDQMATESFDVALAAGNHQIKVEYFEHWGSAALKLRWEPHPCFAAVPPDRWRGEYFNNANLAGPPQMVRDDGDGALNFDWGMKSASANCGMKADDFSARWSRKVILPAGVYRFTAMADDGVRLFVNGKKLMDEWRDQAPANFTGEIFLPAGNHHIVLEYYDRAGGATAKLNWQRIETKKR